MTKPFWQLSSNSGRESVRWEVRDKDTPRTGKPLACDIRLAGQYFGPTLGGVASELRDYYLVFENLTIGATELERLSSTLRSWLQLPLPDQVKHPLAFECKVGSLFDQSLIMSLGQRNDVISGGNPVATFRYVAGRLTGELSFVTDRNCLRVFSEGIDASLEFLNYE